MKSSRRGLVTLVCAALLVAVAGFAAQDVLRFLGRRPEVWRFHTSQLHSSLATRPEGLRVKHQLNHNAVKMYDKQGSVLRVETTINDAADMKAYRSPENNPTAPKEWLPLRKGVADLHRARDLLHPRIAGIGREHAAARHQPVGQRQEAADDDKYVGQRHSSIPLFNRCGNLPDGAFSGNQRVNAYCAA